MFCLLDVEQMDFTTLGPRLLEFVKAPAKRKALKGIDLGSVLLLRGTAKPSRAAA
ncbi:MAG: hypothetical protein M3069_09465 [Chloroflexota bacterium]|nr:hypothetical protein [Chloroflexota bacterium]